MKSEEIRNLCEELRKSSESQAALAKAVKDTNNKIGDLCQIVEKLIQLNQEFLLAFTQDLADQEAQNEHGLDERGL